MFTTPSEHLRESTWLGDTGHDTASWSVGREREAPE